MDFRKILLTLFIIFMAIQHRVAASENIIIPDNFPEKYDKTYVEQIMPLYKAVSKDPVVMVALDMMKDTSGDYSRNAIMGSNLSQRPMKVEFRNLSEINMDYSNFDALGWKKGKNLFIYINAKHKDAPPQALAALLSHEALHQDETNSIAEETYAWTMEAVVWSEILRSYPDCEKDIHPLVKRENNLKKMFDKGNQTNKYIKKEIKINPGYKGLPQTSPGFEDL